MKMKTRIAAFLLALVGISVPAFCQTGNSAILSITGTNSSSASGSITITVNGLPQTVGFGPYSTAASIASGFGAYFSAPPPTPAPPLCASGICAKSNGSTVVFHFQDSVGTPAVSWSATSGSPFSVDTSQWPGAGTLSMTLVCTPSPLIVGNTTSCMAGLPASTAGSVNFTIDGSSWQSGVALDSSGNAVASNGLSGASPGSHLVEAQYTAANSTVYTAYQVVEVQAGSNSSNIVYYYSISTQPGSAPPGAGQSGYQANGNIAAYSDSVNGYWNLSYDSFDRLISSSQGPVGSGFSAYGCWSYDNFGNRTEQASSNQAMAAGCSEPYGASAYSATTMTFTDGTNRITGRGTINQAGTVQTLSAPSYDNVGNIITDQTYPYVYDAQGHMCAAHTSQGMIGYIYDAEGQRVAKGTITTMLCDPTQNGFTVTTVYELGPGGQAMTEVDGGNWSHTDVNAGGTQIATYDSNGVHFQLHDWLGTRRVQTNYAGVVEDTCSSNPFGDQQNCSNSALDVSDKHFTGKERDAESGFDYFGARYYASNDGRWMSPDWSSTPVDVPYATLANPQTLNLYRYVANNPLGGTDVDGHNYYGGDIGYDLYAGFVGRTPYGDLVLRGEANEAQALAERAEDTQRAQAEQQNAQQSQQRAQQPSAQTPGQAAANGPYGSGVIGVSGNTTTVPLYNGNNNSAEIIGTQVITNNVNSHGSGTIKIVNTNQDIAGSPTETITVRLRNGLAQSTSVRSSDGSVNLDSSTSFNSRTGVATVTAINHNTNVINIRVYDTAGGSGPVLRSDTTYNTTWVH